ncbi:MAG: dihydrolipoamide acetyltransferase, partial [Rhodocyclaceae bacterium]|nr:dihydrolipoamide acetyltransferase [Rhodocyclaceae bacterium]
MSQLVEIKVPDIGDFSDVPVIELFVKVGDALAVDDAICTLESDKATMDVPAPAAGIVREVCVSVGTRVSEGALLLKLESSETAAAPEAPAAAQQPAAASGAEPTIDLLVPDIGDFHDVPVIEVFVKTGDTLAVDDAIRTLESDKATMDVPASAAGVLTEVCVQVGDKVSQGALLGRLRTAAANVTQTAA